MISHCQARRAIVTSFWHTIHVFAHTLLYVPWMPNPVVGASGTTNATETSDSHTLCGAGAQGACRQALARSVVLTEQLICWSLQVSTLLLLK